MKVMLCALLASPLFILFGCNSSTVQPTTNPTPVENPDSVVKEYTNGTDFLGSYYLNLHPGLRIDSIEKWTTTNPPYYIYYGKLIVYYNNQFVDSIAYPPNYLWYGVCRPIVTAGYISPTEYLLKIHYEGNQLYYFGKSLWYFINGAGIHKLPKVTNKNENGMYENNSVNIGDVKKNGRKIIFYGYYYCEKETYCTFNIDFIFKNYCRSRSDCYSPWQWE